MLGSPGSHASDALLRPDFGMLALPCTQLVRRPAMPAFPFSNQLFGAKTLALHLL